MAFLSCAEDDPVNPWHPDLTGSVDVVVTPAELSAGWTLTGPDGFSKASQGTQTVAGLAAGEYTLTWSTRTGWHVPTPNPNTQTLVRRGHITFSGIYEPVAMGTVAIQIAPSGLAAPWQITGPGGFQTSGTGIATLSDVPTGSWTNTWGELSGWVNPDPPSQILTLGTGETIEFLGTYTAAAPAVGSLQIDPNPDSIAAPWSVTGPAGYQNAGSGDTLLSDIPVGHYTVTWGTVSDWQTPQPNPVTVTVTEGAVAVATGTYTAIATGNVQIHTLPESISPSWSINGPSGYSNSGFGSLTLPNLTAGTYTVTWGVHSGWNQPTNNPESKILNAGETITFTGIYTEMENTYIGMFVSNNGSDLSTTGTWLANNTYVVHVLLVNVPPSGIAGWEACFVFTGANTVLQDVDLLGGSVTSVGRNFIVEYSPPRHGNANGFLHVASLHFYCGTRSRTEVTIVPVTFIGYTPDVLYFRAGNNPGTDIRLWEWGGQAQFVIE